MELEHLDKHFKKMSKTQEKEASQVNVVSIFLLDTFKTTCRMENLTQRWAKLGPFFPKSIFKKGRGGLFSVP